MSFRKIEVPGLTTIHLKFLSGNKSTIRKIIGKHIQQLPKYFPYNRCPSRREPWERILSQDELDSFIALGEQIPTIPQKENLKSRIFEEATYGLQRPFLVISDTKEDGNSRIKFHIVCPSGLVVIAQHKPKSKVEKYEIVTAFFRKTDEYSNEPHWLALARFLLNAYTESGQAKVEHIVGKRHETGITFVSQSNWSFQSDEFTGVFPEWPEVGNVEHHSPPIQLVPRSSSSRGVESR